MSKDRDEVLQSLVDIGFLSEDEADEVEDNLADDALDEAQFGNDDKYGQAVEWVGGESRPVDILDAEPINGDVVWAWPLETYLAYVD